MTHPISRIKIENPFQPDTCKCEARTRDGGIVYSGVILRDWVQLDWEVERGVKTDSLVITLDRIPYEDGNA